MATRKAKTTGSEPDLDDGQAPATAATVEGEAGAPESTAPQAPQSDTPAANDELANDDKAAYSEDQASPATTEPIKAPDPTEAANFAKAPKVARFGKANAKERAAARKLNLRALKKQRAGTVAIQFHLEVFHAGTSKDRILRVLTLVERTAAQIRVGNGSYLAPKTAETMLTVLDKALVLYKEAGDEAKMQAAALREAAKEDATQQGRDLGQPVLSAEIDDIINCTDAATVATCEAVMAFDCAMLDLEFLQVATGKREYGAQIATVRERFLTGIQGLRATCLKLLEQTSTARRKANLGDDTVDPSIEFPDDEGVGA